MIKEAFNNYAVSLTKTWNYDRTKTVGASEIGQCARKIYAIKNLGTRKGVVADADWTDNWGARVRGTIMEQQFWYPALKARFGQDLLMSGPDQYTLQSGYLSATPDGIIVNQPRDALKHLGVEDIGESSCYMAEAKTIDPRTSLLEAKSENMIQTQVQMGLIRELTQWKPEYDVLTYTDASFWSEVVEFPIRFDAKLYQNTKQRAAIIMNASSFSELKPEGWIAGGKECDYCPFAGACGVERRSGPIGPAKKIDPQFVAEIREFALEANCVEIGIDKLQFRLKDLQHYIKTRLREKGIRKIEGIVNWYEVSGHTYHSQAAMRERLIELGVNVDEFTRKGEPSDRLVISAIPADPEARPAVLMPGKLKKGKGNGKESNRRTGTGTHKGNSNNGSKSTRTSPPTGNAAHTDKPAASRGANSKSVRGSRTGSGTVHRR